MTSAIEVVGVVLGGGGITAIAGVIGKITLQKIRGQESESVRVWARLEAEEARRQALEEDMVVARIERIGLLEEMARGTLMVNEATTAHRAESAALRSDVDAARSRHSQCEEQLSEVTERIVSLEADLARVARRSAQDRRRNSPPRGLRAQQDTGLRELEEIATRRSTPTPIPPKGGK